MFVRRRAPAVSGKELIAQQCKGAGKIWARLFKPFGPVVMIPKDDIMGDLTGRDLLAVLKKAVLTGGDVVLEGWTSDLGSATGGRMELARFKVEEVPNMENIVWFCISHVSPDIGHDAGSHTGLPVRVPDDENAP